MATRLDDHQSEAFRAQVFGTEEAPPETTTEAPPVASPPPPKKSRRLWKILGGIVCLGVALVALGAGMIDWLTTEDGHQWIARQLEANISSQIRGHLTVEHLDDIDLHHVVAHGVVFWDESGRPVIEAHEVDMSYELGDLVHGHFVSHHARATGGRVLMETDASGELLINRAFRSAHPGTPGQPVGEDVVHLDHLETRDVALILHLGSAPLCTLSRVGAMVMVRAPDHGAAIVDADHVHGMLHVEAPIPFDLRAIAGSLAVDGAARRRIHIDLPSRMGDEHIGLEVTAMVQPDDSFHVDARIRPHGLSAMFAAAGMISQALIAETQTPALDVTVEMQ